MQTKVNAGQILPLNAVTGDAPSVAQYLLDPDTLSANLIVGFEQMNARVHPFFTLRSQVLAHARATRQRVFAVTSVQPGNGKTHIAVNLAAALSRIHPTILLELDLRRPSVSKRLGLPGTLPGIDDFLAGEVGWRETSLRIKGFNLSVHRVREARSNPEELLASSRLTDLFEVIRSTDGSPVCIVDVPPSVVHDDLMLVTRAIDGVLMVVEEAKTSKRALLDAINSLSPTPIVGSILNMSISSARQSNDYDYDYYKASC